MIREKLARHSIEDAQNLQFCVRRISGKVDSRLKQRFFRGYLNKNLPLKPLAPHQRNGQNPVGQDFTGKLSMSPRMELAQEEQFKNEYPRNLFRISEIVFIEILAPQ